MPPFLCVIRDLIPQDKGFLLSNRLFRTLKLDTDVVRYLFKLNDFGTTMDVEIKSWGMLGTKMLKTGSYISLEKRQKSKGVSELFL